jgi:hypothetical protein
MPRSGASCCSPATHQAEFKAREESIINEYEKKLAELRAMIERLKADHASAMAALRAELVGAMAKALADLEARLNAEHAKQIEALLADAAAKLAAALAAMRADYDAQLAALRAQAERDAAELAYLRSENARLKLEAAEADAIGIYYDRVRKDLESALQLPMGKVISSLVPPGSQPSPEWPSLTAALLQEEIIGDLGKFQAEAEAAKRKRSI